MNMKLENFLPQDQFQAVEEDNCLKNCLYVATVATGGGEYEKALYVLEHAKRSLIELQKMKERKEIYDKKIEIAILLKKAGVML